MNSLDNLLVSIAPIAKGINDYAISAYYHDNTDFKETRIRYIVKDIKRMTKAIHEYEDLHGMAHSVMDD